MATHDSDDEDSFDEADKMPAPIQRGRISGGGSFARLSTAIRRSLRLPPRRVSRQAEDLPLKQGDADLPTFSQWTNLHIHESAVPSRLDEIKENQRLNRHEKVKKLLRKGNWPMNHDVRKQLWILLCQDKNYDSMRNLYERKMVEEGSIDFGKARHPAFMKEEGAVVNNFTLNEEGAMRLLRLLGTVENDHPTMTSAPFLYPLCALLLHYMSESDSYACTEFLLRKGFLIKSTKEWYASSYTVLALIKKHKSSVYALLKRRCNTHDDEVLVETVRDYLQWIFRGLPTPYVVRLIDCYLVEGQKFILRAAIAIVYIWAKMNKGTVPDHYSGLSNQERIHAVKEEIYDVARKCDISTDTFINTCIRIKNLKSSNITRLQSYFETQVQAEVERRKKLRASSRAPPPLYTEVFQSKIVDAEQAGYIMQSLPPRLQLSTPRLLFRLSQDGASFTHMWSKIDEADQTLIIIRSTKADIFGAYCSACWAERNDRRERTKSKYFGTGESFVFKIDKNDVADLPVIYQWVGNNNEQADGCPQMFMAAGDKMLVIGSGNGDAIRISEELTHGMTGYSKTFESPPLVDNRAFDIHEMEVFGVSTAN